MTAMRRFKQVNRRRPIFDHLEARRLLALVLSPINITATKGTAFDGVVATLVDTTGADNPSSFTTSPGSVQINWGDGSTTPGQVVGPVYPGVFEVEGSHTYTSGGGFVTQINVTDQSGYNAIANGSAIVTSQPPQFTIVGQTIAGNPNVALSNVTVATFLDTNTSDTPSDFQALITWGDGNASIGTVQGGNGAFTVTGSHTYIAAGTYPTNVTVLDVATGKSAVATGQALITAASPNYTLTGGQIVETSGVPFTATVATFTDTNLSDTASDFTAAINWGNGHTSTGTVTGSNGSFSISGSYTYAVPGTYNVLVTLDDQAGRTAATTATATVTGPVLTPLPTTFTPSIGQPFTGTVASFFDTNTSDTAADLKATITWGDGHVSAGTVVAVPGTPELFDVQGTDTYSAAGTFPVSVVIVNTGGQTATANSTAIVAAPTLIATGTTFPATPGVPLNGVTVANFTDTNPNATAANITAVINWGDGTTSTGTIKSTASTGSFTVTGSHTYAAPASSGSYTVTVSIADPSGQTATANSTAIVAANIAAAGTTFSVTPGVTFTNQTVATFADTNSNAASSTALINWGDGTTSTGTVNATGTPGLFTVTGTHVYAAPSSASSYAVTVTVVDPSGQTAKASSTAIVATPLSATGTVFTATPGQPVTATVATFTDSNPVAIANPSSILARINWGDGQSSPGVIHFISMSGSTGLFDVTGTHTYSTPVLVGSFTVTVSITDPSGQAARVTSTAVVLSYLNTTGTTFSVTPGQSFTETVANFTDSNPNANAANLKAVITWGDGQTTAGVVNSTGSAGSFTVTGTHTYASSNAAGLFPVLVTIIDPSGQTAIALTTAIVTTSIAATGTTFTATPGVPLANQVVATFTDSSPLAASSTALIRWGDGTTSAGTVQPATVVNPSSPPGTYVVTGSRTYPPNTSAASETVTVTIVDPSGQSATATSTAIFTTLIVATGTTFTVTPASGAPPTNQVVATFTDSNVAAASSTVAINWGNGVTTAGMVTGPNAAGVYTVVGTPPYSASSPATSYTVTVTIIDPSGRTATANSTAIVVIPAPSNGSIGGLADVISNGPHAASGFTNTDRPVFSGTAPPYSIVQIDSRHFNVDAQLPLGEAVADGNGQWTFTAGPLAVGTYIFTATITVPGGYPSNPVTLTNANGTDLVYIDLTPRLVRWLSHGEKAVPHHHPRLRVPHPSMPRPPRAGRHKA